MKKNQSKDPQDRTVPIRWREAIKIIILSIFWIALMIASFYTYYTIPILIFISWWISAWIIKAVKGDKHDGSAYDEEN